MLTVRRHVFPHVSTHRVNLGVISYKLAHANLAASAQLVCLHVQSAGMQSLCDYGITLLIPSFMIGHALLANLILLNWM